MNYRPNLQDLEAARAQTRLPDAERKEGETPADSIRRLAKGWWKTAQDAASHRARTDDAALVEALNGEDEAALMALAVLIGYQSPKRARCLSEFDGQPPPDPVIWRDTEDSQKWPLVSVGEPGLIAAAGGSGKSYVSLALALAATGEGEACGLRVREGPALLVSYEDSPVRLAQRARLICEAAAPDGLHVLVDPEPLMAADPNERGALMRLPGLDRLAGECKRLLPSLVVLDPVGEALADVDAANATAVRRWYAAALDAVGDAGLLAIGHSTKASRNLTAAGGEAGAGVVAGSSAWFDRARGVAHMRPATEGRKLLHVIKSNHGRTGWGSMLKEAQPPGKAFAGWVLDNDGKLSPDQVQKEIKAAKPKKSDKSDNEAAGDDPVPLNV